MHELLSTSAKRLAAAIRDKDVSCEEMVRACLDRIDAVNPQLNAVVHLCRERALTEAQERDRAVASGESLGPLHGVPMTIKDTFDTAGVQTTYATLGRADHVPTTDATAVARVRAAGAVLIGKTNTPELTLSYDTDNLVHGRTHNPYDLTRAPGGSSGGAVAILAACGSFFDIGSDLGGSIRLPAHFSGVAGLKPTTGRVPRTGHFPPPRGVYQRMIHVGPLSRYVEDLELLLPLLGGPDGRDPFIAPVPLRSSSEVELEKLRGAFFVDNGVVPASEETAQVVRDAVEALSHAGLRFDEARPEGIEDTVELHAGLLRGWDGGALVRSLLEASGTPEERSMLTRYLEAPAEGPEKLVELRDRWDRLCERALAFFERYDLMVSPVHAEPALTPEELPNYYQGASYTMTQNLTGWPAAVVRAGTSSKELPIGVQITAAPWRDDVALAGAKCVEEALGGWRPPSI